MQQKPSDQKTVDALLQLAANAEAPPPASGGEDEEETYRVGPPADVPPPPPIELPSMGPASSADPISKRIAPKVIGAEADDPRKICLYCGYLLDTRELRCPECGTLFAAHVYERWFGGDEQRRFENVRWLLLAALFMKTWIWIPGIGPYTNLLALGAIAFACWRAAEQKTEGPAGFYGIAGATGCLFMACLSLGSGNFLGLVLECAVAGCLLAGMVSDVDRFDVLAEKGYKNIARAFIVAAPILAGVFFGANRLIATTPTLAAPPASAVIQGVFLGSALLVNLAVWAFTTWTIHRISRTLFSPPENLD